MVRKASRKPELGTRGTSPPLKLVGESVAFDGRLLGLSLQFGSRLVAIGEMSYEGSTKSSIGDLGSILGLKPYMGRMIFDGERVKERRITRGHCEGSIGLTAVLWPL
jgi:hypothetical protein